MVEKELTKTEIIDKFLSGFNPMERIISIECDFNDEEVSIIYRNESGVKKIKKDDFKPFVWAKASACVRMFGGDRKLLKEKMKSFGITVKKLKTSMDGNEVHERLENGYKYIFKATRKMSYQTFLMFFNAAKTPIYNNKKKKDDSTKDDREFLAVSPVEQYMMYSGCRMFKGYQNYDDLVRMQFDLETQGLDPKVHKIEQIGIRTNKGFEKVLSIDENLSEFEAIKEMLSIISKIKPDIIAGHNSENFDWNFIIVRCEMLGYPLNELSLEYFAHPIYKKDKETVLKLGGEVEYYRPTIMWGFNIIDSLHAVRRAQAIDSSMKSATLKYVTKYLKLKKDNRVYVPGDKISETWNVLSPSYAFNNSNGDWYRMSDKRGLLEGYEAVSGRYIVERYLLDDIWETDKIELKLNESNFLIGKMLPTSFQRACTMGTAGIWKLIMLAWCYENGLGVPAFGKQRSFTGGLSRLLNVGYADNVVKLDYNSLYPSIILTWNIKTNLDISNSMVNMLEYVLTQREKYKELKGVAGKKAKQIKEQLENFNGTPQEKKNLINEMKGFEAEAAANDKKQLPLKILANSFFGSFGSPNIFPFGDTSCAEETTCAGRMSLRLMISHFNSIGYKPIVGDSVTYDTPLFIKYNDNDMIDIKPISEIIDESSIKVDELGREYDYSKKGYKVLCRSGWSDVKYVYRHKTDKPIYRVDDGKSIVDVTEDHSLFDENKNEIKPSEINENTKLEYSNIELNFNKESFSDKFINTTAKLIANGTLDRIPYMLLNCNKESAEKFLNVFNEIYKNNITLSKTCLSGLMFLNKKVL